VRYLGFFGVTASLALLVGFTQSSAEGQGAKPGSAAAVGIPQRTLWTTSRVKGTPEPPPPYRTRNAFPKLKFNEPLHMAATPSLDRMFIAERHGKIFSFATDPNTDKAELFLDLGKTMYGFTFHPKFDQNRYVYVTYILDPAKPVDPKGSRIARFQADQDNPLKCDPKTETVILEWPSGGHNGGCLDFGNDGMLYLATGDGSGIADELQTGQDISDLLACMLRIDVDHPDAGRQYGIPKDNPFVNTPGARPEVWAYGLRQAWKFSFDRPTGDLWAGEVGQDLWEMVYRVVKGGNYGWSVKEGSHPFRPERKLGPTPIQPPLFEHPHIDYRSITGGFVYHGKRLPELTGAYIYGDFDTGRVAALRTDSSRTKVTEQRELTDTALRIVVFGENPRTGELYLVDFIGGGIHELVPSPPAEKTADFPRKLSETGLFASTKDHVPAPGLIPYSVNAELWSDHAIKERFLALPGDSQIEFETMTYPGGPGAAPGWKFPDGTVVVKTFSMEMEAGNPASRRRLETRILHHERLAGTEEIGDQVWRGYTYVWNDSQTDAELLDANGLDRELTIRDSAAPGGMRKQTWHFPSRAECTLCHTMPAKFVLGVNTLQMNKDHTYPGGVVANQLRTLDHLGIFTKPLPTQPEELPKLANPRDAAADLDKRARAYLHSNCSHCHMKWGGGNAEFQLLATMPLNELGVLGVRPGQGDFGLANPHVLVPGDPDRSMVYHRMTKLGLGRMPHIASTVIDEPAVKLIHDWIKSLKDQK
jgi:uncharacterized repeat protein (TIGR03806 family)